MHHLITNPINKLPQLAPDGNYCAPTALQRLFHYEGEIGVAKAAEKFGTMFGISSLGTASIEEISNLVS